MACLLAEFRALLDGDAKAPRLHIVDAFGPNTFRASGNADERNPSNGCPSLCELARHDFELRNTWR